MFGTIRRHQTWLWAIIITLTIISFVIFFSPYTRSSQSVRRGDHGSINGQIITMDDFNRAYIEVLLQYFFMSHGQWYSDSQQGNFDPKQRTYLRLFTIQKQ